MTRKVSLGEILEKVRQETINEQDREAVNFWRSFLGKLGSQTNSKSMRRVFGADVSQILLEDIEIENASHVRELFAVANQAFGEIWNEEDLERRRLECQGEGAHREKENFRMRMRRLSDLQDRIADVFQKRIYGSLSCDSTRRSA